MGVGETVAAAWTRRDLLAAAGGAAAAALSPLARPSAAAEGAPALGEPEPFSFERLIEQARALAAQPFRPPPPLPEWLARLSPEQHGAIRAAPDRAIRLGAAPYEVRPLHLGGYFREPVRLFLVEEGVARQLLYDPALFALGGVQPPPEAAGPETGFSGLRLSHPLGPGGGYEELLAFHGTSYFRAVARGTRAGASARGLAIDTGLGRPEEFPTFTRFWLLQPPNPADPLTVCALLEGRSVAGAYRFVVVPREATAMQVDASLFFRERVEQAGVAPLNAMFHFAPNDRAGIDDYRERVHTAGGLSVWRGNGEVLWRPLVAPGRLRLSVFEDENPRGFGLLQRERDLGDYRDLEARFDLRPNLWVEPRGAWGRGSVRLIEVPTEDETHDNIVAFWTPAEPVEPGSELRLAYGLAWSLAPPLQTGLAPVLGTAVGRGGRPGDRDRPPGLRRVAIDFAAPFGQAEGVPAPEPVLECGSVECTRPPVLRPNPATGGWRVGFEARVGEGAAELRCFLSQGGRPVSETWLYRLDNS